MPKKKLKLEKTKVKRLRPCKEVSVMAWVQDAESRVLLVRQTAGQKLWNPSRREGTAQRITAGSAFASGVRGDRTARGRRCMDRDRALDKFKTSRIATPAVTKKLRILALLLYEGARMAAN